MDLQNGTLTSQLTVSGIQLAAACPFSAGHILRENEAGVLNQTFHENLRNNFASRVDKAKEEAKKAEKEVDLKTLQAEFDKYTAEYDFGVNRGGARTSDPIEREARKDAREKISDALKKQGIILKNITTDQWNDYIDKAIDKYPQFRAAAKAAAAARAATTATLELSV